MTNRMIRLEDLDLSRPWLIEERRARDLLAAVLKGQTAEIIGESFQPKNRSFLTPGGTQVIDIKGPLFHYDNLWTEWGCGSSYHSIYRELEKGLADPMVQNILFVIDSPGGEISGLAELAEYIVEADKQKPVYSHVVSMCASAAYWIAVSTRRITSVRVAYTGCIGALSVIEDDRRAMEEAGIDQFVFVSSISPNKHADPKTEQGASQIQAHVNELGKIFVDYVAERRLTTAENVINNFGKGDVVLSDQALSLGMIDGIGNLRIALQSIESPEAENMLGINEAKEEVKDEVEEDENVESQEEEDQEDRETPEDDENDSDAQEEEEEEEEEEEDMDEATAVFMVKHKKMARKLMAMGSKKEAARIRSLIEANDLYPHNTKAFRSALLDGRTTGESYLMASMKRTKTQKKRKLNALNADAADIPNIDANQTVNAAESLNQRAVEHAKTLAVKARR